MDIKIKTFATLFSVKSGVLRRQVFGYIRNNVYLCSDKTTKADI